MCVSGYFFVIFSVIVSTVFFPHSISFPLVNPNYALHTNKLIGFQPLTDVVVYARSFLVCVSLFVSLSLCLNFYVGYYIMSNMHLLFMKCILSFITVNDIHQPAHWPLAVGHLSSNSHTESNFSQPSSVLINFKSMFWGCLLMASQPFGTSQTSTNSLNGFSSSKRRNIQFECIVVNTLTHTAILKAMFTLISSRKSSLWTDKGFLECYTSLKRAY